MNPARFAQEMALAGYTPADTLTQLLRFDAGVELSDAVQAIADGFGQAGDTLPPVALQEALRVGSQAAASQYQVSLDPPVPQVQLPGGGSLLWMLPLWTGGHVSSSDVQMVAAGATLMVNTGTLLTFLDPGGQATAAVTATGFEPRVDVAGGVVYALDAAAGQLHAYRPDGSEVWPAVSMPPGQHICAGDTIVHQQLPGSVLTGIDAATGARKWAPANPLRFGVDGIATDGTRVFFKDKDDQNRPVVHAINAADGTTAWVSTADRNSDGEEAWALRPDIAVIAGMVCCGTNESVRFFDGETGTPFNTFSVPSQAPPYFVWGPGPKSHLAVYGWLSSVGFVIDMTASDPLTPFPNLAHSRHGFPDANTNGPTYPCPYGSATLFCWGSADDDTAHVIRGTVFGAGSMMLKPMVTVTGGRLIGQPVIDGTTLYALLAANEDRALPYLMAVQLPPAPG